MPAKKKKETELEYYDIEKLISKYPNCEYYFPFGEKSSGKTYSINLHCLKDYFKRKACFAYIRRTDVDLKSSSVRSMFNDICNNELKKISDGKYTGIVGWKDGFYLVSKEGKKDPEPFCYCFALNATKHTNGSSFPMVKNIFVDEVITRDEYLPNELDKLQTLMSNIVRSRGDATIFMAGNTWNKYSPYFKYFGFDPTKMKEGEMKRMEVDNVSGEQTPVAIERTKPAPQGKPSDKYFLTAEKTSTVSMITHGAWVCESYPKSQLKWDKTHVLQEFYVIFDGHYITGNIVDADGNPFLFFFPKKDKYIHKPQYDMVYCDTPSYRRNYYQSITRPCDNPTRFVAQLFQRGKAFYADDDTGEILRNYILFSIQNSGMGSKMRL